MNELRVLILARGSSVRSALAAAAAHPEIEVVDTASPDPAVVSRLAKEGMDAVVLYNDGTEASYELAERIYISKTVFSLIMVSPDMSQDSLERAMACGANRLLPQSAAETELARVILQTVGREKNRASSTVLGDYYSSCVLSVFGTKGGAGKTTFAVNLAAALANRSKKVALVDLDLQFGDVGIFLDIEKADSIADVVEENAFDYASMKSYLFSHPGGVVGLCAPPSPEFAEIVLPEHVSRVVSSLKPHYDYVMDYMVVL
jgi:pilus assembly protein CpaE